MILREEMKYDKSEHTKAHRQRPVGACDATDNGAHHRRDGKCGGADMENRNHL